MSWKEGNYLCVSGEVRIYYLEGVTYGSLKNPKTVYDLISVDMRVGRRLLRFKKMLSI
jgi:hypothetical protein